MLMLWLLSQKLPHQTRGRLTSASEGQWPSLRLASRLGLTGSDVCPRPFEKELEGPKEQREGLFHMTLMQVRSLVK